jgi:transcriptional regulator with XRE-family HTH domain
MLTMTERPSAAARRAAFGKALAFAMQTADVSQRQLGDHVGISQSAISEWVNGNNEPTAEDVFKAEAFLGVEPGRLSQHLGYLPPAARGKAPYTFEQAIADDPDLSEDQREYLRVMYREYVKRSGRRRPRKKK